MCRGASIGVHGSLVREAQTMIVNRRRESFLHGLRLEGPRWLILWDISKLLNRVHSKAMRRNLFTDAITILCYSVPAWAEHRINSSVHAFNIDSVRVQSWLQTGYISWLTNSSNQLYLTPKERGYPPRGHLVPHLHGVVPKLNKFSNLLLSFISEAACLQAKCRTEAGYGN